MGNVALAKEKVKNLTLQIEKDLYILKYGDSEYTKLTDNVYDKLKEICLDELCEPISFPLKKIDGEIYLDEENENLYKVLHILADDFSIILNHEEIG